MSYLALWVLKTIFLKVLYRSGGGAFCMFVPRAHCLIIHPWLVVMVTTEVGLYESWPATMVLYNGNGTHKKWQSLLSPSCNVDWNGNALSSLILFLCLTLQKTKKQPLHTIKNHFHYIALVV